MSSAGRKVRCTLRVVVESRRLIREGEVGTVFAWILTYLLISMYLVGESW